MNILPNPNIFDLYRRLLCFDRGWWYF